MRKYLFSLAVVTVASLCLQHTSAQWSLSGNSNASTSSKLGTTNAIPLNLYTKNTARLRIDTLGHIGVNTAPVSDAQLQMNSASSIRPMRLLVNGSTRFLFHYNGGLTVGNGTAPPSQGLYVSGNVGIGTATPSYKLEVNGGSGNAIYAHTTGNYAVYGASNYLGIYGQGNNYGVYGYSGSGYGVGASSSDGYGVYAYSSSTYSSNGSTGVYGNAYYGVHGAGTLGVWGESSNYIGVYGTGYTYGVFGYSSNAAYGVYGSSSSSYSSNGSSGVYGTGYYGVQGNSSTGYGLYARGYYDGAFIDGSSNGYSSSYGVYSTGNSIGTYGFGGSYGLYGSSTNGNGVYGYSANSYGVVGRTGASGGWGGVFYGLVYSSAGYQTSDKRLKKNIEDFSDALSLINKLQPKSYEFRQDGKMAAMNLPQGKHYGLIAQDLEQVLPNLVKEVNVPTSKDSVSAPLKSAATPASASVIDPKNPTKPAPLLNAPQTPSKPTDPEMMTIKSVNYIELIPILVKGMQEQQKQIEELKNEVAQLKGNGFNSLTGSGHLMQASPNPSSTTTRISYSLPSGISQAQLLLTDAQGKMIRSISLNNSGNVDLNTSGLSSGVYNYSLYVDGKPLDTKKLVVAR